jgi:hypothetical protein
MREIQKVTTKHSHFIVTKIILYTRKNSLYVKYKEIGKAKPWVTGGRKATGPKSIRTAGLPWNKG